MKKTKKLSLKENIIMLLLLGWVIPVLTIALVFAIYVDKKSGKLVEEAVLSSANKASELFEIELTAAEKASKNASYYSNIREAYLARSATPGAKEFKTSVTGFLNAEYKYNSISRAAIITFKDGITFYTYNNSTGASYKNIEYYLDKVYGEAENTASSLGTGIKLVSLEGNNYMVRNLMLPNFKPYAVLTIELNNDSFLEGYESVWGYSDIVILKDGKYMMGNESMLKMGDVEDIKEAGLTVPTLLKKYGNDTFATVSDTYYGSRITAIIRLNTGEIYSTMYATRVILGFMLLFMVPLIIIFFRFFKTHVTKPIDEMLVAYKKISEKEYGYQINANASSKEFFYMQESFNHMSAQIKEQFIKIYMEEIALRDARIMALQSQINPHFLNNTFEIINWEARLKGNVKVSKMIEALSTMLEATMNRRGEHMHLLSKEMEYVDAYVYIISERLGDKFSYTKNIDKTLMDVEIPRLIIQPIVENAVEHGIGALGRGDIQINIYEKGEYIRIDIINDGILNKKNREKIDALLKDKNRVEAEDSLSLGIRNVNNRLKLIYGEDCGLSIEGMGENTVSRILIRKQNRHSRV